MTESRRYPLLFSPLRIGAVDLRNRIVFSAHLTNYAEDGLPSAQHAAYYEARAAGGAGLIITEEHSTHPTDWPYEKLIHGYRDEVLSGYRRITDAVHRHGAAVFAQINHNGGQSSSLYTRRVLWAPSAVADPLFREVPHAVDQAEIAEIVAGYQLVAAHCREGGFDGVELQCSHSSIVRQFLSPLTNLRTDSYGGDLEGRSRLLLELLAAVREAVGPALALGVRLCGDELQDGGTTITDAVEVARLIERQGSVDYVNTSIGVATDNLYMIEASMHVPPGYAAFIPSAIRAAVDLPVVGGGRVKDPLQAERALREGQCDLVGIVRGQIADADFARKARAGDATGIRLCLSCNQECVGRMGLNRWLGCIENPLTGREGAARPPEPRHRSGRRVVVVGAGPAGLQAALAAARRGRRVTVLESAAEAGGAVRLAATAPGRAELGDLVRNQLIEIERLGVSFAFGTTADPEAVAALQPSSVVVATGARPAPPSFVAEGAVAVADVREVLAGSVAPAGAVLVLDETGFYEATSVAELLADRGCDVSLVTPAMVVGQDLGVTLDLEGFMMRAARKHLRLATDRLVLRVEGDEVVLLHHPTGREERARCDWVVCAVPPVAQDSLYFALRASLSCPVVRVGDCVAPRRAHAAVLEGEAAGAAA